MPVPQSYDGQVPFGKMSITGPGATTQLSVNCGNFGGAVGGTPSNPPAPGAAAQQFTVQADKANTGNLYLLPRGKTAAGNPASIMCQLQAGQSVTYPAGLGGPGMQPENYCLDTDGAGTQLAYGYATMVG